MFLQTSQNSQENTYARVFFFRQFCEISQSGCCFCISTRSVYCPTTAFCLFGGDSRIFSGRVFSRLGWLGVSGPWPRWLAWYLGLAVVFVWGGARGGGGVISVFHGFSGSIGGAFVLVVGGLGAGLSFYGVWTLSWDFLISWGLKSS